MFICKYFPYSYKNPYYSESFSNFLTECVEINLANNLVNGTLWEKIHHYFI